MLNAFTVDVEDYYHVTAFENEISRADWGRFESRVTGGTHRVLELLARHQTRATFYVLGWIADRFPGLVREIDAAGHEIGSHSYWHRLVYELSPDEFRQDLAASLKAIEDAIGKKVVHYRAPSFSITKRSLWALDILAEHGIHCDSSVFPIVHDRYGIPDAKPYIHQVATSAGPLWEFPPSVARVAGVNLPVSGGGYFRLYPLSWTARWLKQINRRGRPFMFYIHPWELDPSQPRLSAGSRLSRIRHRVNLASTERKLDQLLSRFRFGQVGDVLAHGGMPPEAIRPRHSLVGEGAIAPGIEQCPAVAG
jgi:polysaccharide deacetylase family protein (PEP-CTERM system associated)